MRKAFQLNNRKQNYFNSKKKTSRELKPLINTSVAKLL